MKETWVLTDMQTDLEDKPLQGTGQPPLVPAKCRQIAGLSFKKLVGSMWVSEPAVFGNCGVHCEPCKVLAIEENWPVSQEHTTLRSQRILFRLKHGVFCSCSKRSLANNLSQNNPPTDEYLFKKTKWTKSPQIWFTVRTRKLPCHVDTLPYLSSKKQRCKGCGHRRPAWASAGSVQDICRSPKWPP